MSSIVLVAAFFGVGLFFSFAYMADREKPLRWVVYLLLAWVNIVALSMGLVFALVGVLSSTEDMLAESLEAPGMGTLSPEVVAAITSRLPWFGVISLGVGIVGLLLLVPIVRRAVSRLLPTDADRAVHTVALQVATHLVGLSAAVALFFPVILLDEAVLEATSTSTAGAGLGVLWAQSLGFVVLSLLGVGFVIQRDLRSALDRLGLTPSFHWKWWIAGTLVALASSVAVDKLWSVVDSQGLEEVGRLSDALFAPYLGYGLIGALTIGLSAGIGEEILFRGAAQPRLGLIFTSLLFAAVHTQYSVSLALLQIFVVGMLLGLTRRHANTTTAIATHATYNFVLALIAIYLPGLTT